MENTQNYLQVLSESLDKKTVILKELQRLTGIQKEIVEAEEFDDEAFNANVEMKAALITELQKMDNGFQILYNNTKDQLESGRERYASEIKVLQQKISVIMDLNASLQVAEANNKKLVEKRFAALRKEVQEIFDKTDKRLNLETKPSVILVVGVNGVLVTLYRKN